MTRPMIRFDKVFKAYGTHEVLKALDFIVEKGEVVSIIGPSGSGNTTGLRVLMTLEGIQAGTMYVDDEPHNRMEVNGEMVVASQAHIRACRFLPDIGRYFPELAVVASLLRQPKRWARYSANYMIGTDRLKRLAFNPRGKAVRILPIEVNRIVDAIGVSPVYDRNPECRNQQIRNRRFQYGRSIEIPRNQARQRNSYLQS